MLLLALLARWLHILLASLPGRDVLQHLNATTPRRPRKFRSRPEAGPWCSHKTVAEGDRSCALVKDHSHLEVIAAGVRQLSGPLKSPDSR